MGARQRLWRPKLRAVAAGAGGGGGGGGAGLLDAITLLPLPLDSPYATPAPNSVTTGASGDAAGNLTVTFNNPAAVYDGCSEADCWVFDPAVLNENYDPATSIIVLKADVTGWPNGANGNEVIAIGFGEDKDNMAASCTLAAMWDASASGAHRAYGMTASGIGSFSNRANTTSLVAYSIPRSGVEPADLYLKQSVGNAIGINGGQNGVTANAIIVAVGAMAAGSTAGPFTVNVGYRIFALEQLYTTS